MPENVATASVNSISEFKVLINGTETPRTIAKVSVHVSKVVNKISSATLVIQDGQASDGKFPLTDGDLFKPGNKIDIQAGTPREPMKIFSGIIIKQSLKIRDQAAPLLTLECRHPIYKTTIGRKNAYFHDQTDDAILSSILKKYGFEASNLQIDATSVTHKEMVQYNCTDWDFMVSRAEANGMVFLTNSDAIAVVKPAVADDVALSVLHGRDIIELDAEMDSRNQFTTVKSRSWNMSKQERNEFAAASPSDLQEEGSLKINELASISGLAELQLNHAGAVPAGEMQAWADAQLFKSRLSKIRGRIKIQGRAGINPGDVLELSGLGAHFNGKAFVSGVRQEHTHVDGWKTHIQFGNTPDWFIEEKNITAPKAGGLLPGAVGLHIGKVTDNEDPEGEQRVRVKMPFINPEDDGVWARIALADAGENRGLFFRPEIDDEVVLGFLFDDPRQPVILGMFHSSNKVPPINPKNANFKKGYTSREQLKLTFDDEVKEVLVETPAGNKLFVSDEKTGISLEDQNGHRITTEPDAITIKDSKSNEIHIDVNAGIINIKSNSKVIVDAPQIELVDGATHPLVFGDELLTYLNQIVNIYQTHMHPGELALGALPVTPAPPVPPMPPPTPALLSFKVKTD